MAITILDCTMTSDRTPHTARRATDQPGWEVSWLPGRRLTRNQATTAMALAEACNPEAVRSNAGWDRLRPHIQGWAAELDLPLLKALTKVANPPVWEDTAKDAAHADPEAGG